MKSLVSVLLLNSFVLSKNEYTGTVVRESDEVYSQETFENFSNSSWTKKSDNLMIRETEEAQGHVLEVLTTMDGNERGILETNVKLPGDCDNVAILYISFKLFLSGKLTINIQHTLLLFTLHTFFKQHNPLRSLPKNVDVNFND